MADKKSVLLIGLDPALIDFSRPGYAPGMDATKVLAGLRSSEDELIALGYSCANVFDRLWRDCGAGRSKQT
jgi:hypothetical protein